MTMYTHLSNLSKCLKKQLIVSNEYSLQRKTSNQASSNEDIRSNGNNVSTFKISHNLYSKLHTLQFFF